MCATSALAGAEGTRIRPDGGQPGRAHTGSLARRQHLVDVEDLLAEQRLPERLRRAVGPERFEVARSVLLSGLDVLELRDRVRRRAIRPPGGELNR
jgi:hypothetical protein